MNKSLRETASFAPTKIPNVKYELSRPPVTVKSYRSENIQASVHINMIHKACVMLDEEFQKLDREKEVHETHAQNQHLLRQKQELQDMLTPHRTQNERRERQERKELCELKEDVLQEQERLKEEQCNIQKPQKRSEQLLSIMQQFKGM